MVMDLLTFATCKVWVAAAAPVLLFTGWPSASKLKLVGVPLNATPLRYGMFNAFVVARKQAAGR